MGRMISPYTWVDTDLTVGLPGGWMWVNNRTLTSRCVTAVCENIALLQQREPGKPKLGSHILRQEENENEVQYQNGK